jgi:hypothetical protein
MSLPDQTSGQILGFLRDHRVALALRFGFVPAVNRGQHIEGATRSPNENLAIARG